MTRKVLLSWIGGNDLQATEGALPGPLCTTLLERDFDDAYLLYNYPQEQVKTYLDWLGTQVHTSIHAKYVRLKSPIDFPDIHKEADALLSEVSARENTISILLSPGTPAMQTIWLLLGKTRYPARFIQSSKEKGVEDIDIPFDISAEFTPVAIKLAAGSTNIDAAFDDIITKNARMRELKVMATTMASWSIPVLITGESGTGKELFATAIHNASQRQDNPFVVINCGSIPSELIDTELFGHVKGAFTGATSDRKGCFEQADGGTLFLDELGELPLDSQVRLLRVLQDGIIRPVGSDQSVQVDVRIVAATHRDLISEIAAGHFREDLFYRMAVGVLELPPLRERAGDISLLADLLLNKINEEVADTAGYISKKLSPNGRNVILRHEWRGNIRELNSTLWRASLWSEGEVLGDKEITKALFKSTVKNAEILGRSIENGVDLQSVIDEVEKHYIERALAKVGNKKKDAAKLVGLNNHQTLTKRMKKLGIEE